MTLVRWNPMRDFSGMQRRWNGMFDDFFGSHFDGEMVERRWRPRVDIIEDEDSYKVISDLPGMKKEDVQITLEDGELIILGERKFDHEEKDDTCHLSERVHGRFTRKFSLRSSIDASKINANFADGVLTVTLPKVEEAKPRKIEIKAH